MLQVKSLIWRNCLNYRLVTVVRGGGGRGCIENLRLKKSHVTTPHLWSRKPTVKLADLNCGVSSNSGPPAGDSSSVTKQFRHSPEVKALFLFAYFCTMGLTKRNFPFFGAEGTYDTHFIFSSQGNWLRIHSRIKLSCLHTVQAQVSSPLLGRESAEFPPWTKTSTDEKWHIKITEHASSEV